MLPPSAMTHDPARLLATDATFGDRYRIVRCIRSGGMGAVYEAVHGETGRRVALKVMLPSLVSDPALRARFKLEATVAAAVESEHIVDVLDAGIDAASGAPFLVMELLRGEDVATALRRRGPLPFAEVVQLLAQAALALDRTHARGIVHRDLKPDNLFLTQRDDGSPRLKILDFGIAKVMAENPAAGHQTATVGTPLYMSPEQIKGEAIGTASDRYALGHIAYALLVGRSYWADDWEGGPVYPLLLRVMKGGGVQASSRALAHGVRLPPAFDGWFDRATAVEPSARFPSSGAAVDALAEVLDVQVPRSVASNRADRERAAPAPSIPPHRDSRGAAVDSLVATVPTPPTSVDFTVSTGERTSVMDATRTAPSSSSRRASLRRLSVSAVVASLVVGSAWVTTRWLGAPSTATGPAASAVPEPALVGSPGRGDASGREEARATLPAAAVTTAATVPLSTARAALPAGSASTVPAARPSSLPSASNAPGSTRPPQPQKRTTRAPAPDPVGTSFY